MKKPDEVAEAKAKLLKLAGDFDPLEAVRQHPLAAVAIAAASGAAVGSDPKCVANVTQLVRIAIEMIKANLDRRAAEETSSGGAQSG
jgi:hypothetical protein